jgi:hypothetical protein
MILPDRLKKPMFRINDGGPMGGAQWWPEDRTDIRLRQEDTRRIAIDWYPQDGDDLVHRRHLRYNGRRDRAMQWHSKSELPDDSETSLG